MKMFKKSSLSMIDGMIVSESTGDIVIPDVRIVIQANELETMLQKARYLHAQPEATPMPSLDGFERKSIQADKLKSVEFEALTPMLDLQAAKTLAMLDEIDDHHVVEEANKLLGQFAELLAFVDSDFVVDCGGNTVEQFDTPMLGNVLELSKVGVVEAVAEIAGLGHDDDDDDDDDDSFPVMRRIHTDEMSDDDKRELLRILSNYDEDIKPELDEDDKE